jgi:hypothetical protein
MEVHFTPEQEGIAQADRREFIEEEMDASFYSAERDAAAEPW